MEKRYLPHTLETRLKAVQLYRSTKDINHVIRRYHVSKSSLMRWNRKYDGTKESLEDKSHKPKKLHPRSHTAEEIKWIKDYMRRNPNLSQGELFGKLVSEKGYTRSYTSLYRVLVRLGYRSKAKKKKKKHNKNYDTPFQLGLKWQIDVKYVPKDCYVGTMPDKFYQYTCIDECSRERFIYAYKEQSGYSTCDFLKRCIKYYGYAPQLIQTDNGAEFCNIVKTEKKHAFDILCDQLNVQHKKIRPRTPQHNGKVERSHRSDQERFYDCLKFFDFADLQKQMAAYRRRANNIPMRVLGWKSPKEFRKEIESFSEWFEKSLNCAIC